jgi:hypothetical protein
MFLHRLHLAQVWLRLPSSFSSSLKDLIRSPFSLLIRSLSPASYFPSREAAAATIKEICEGETNFRKGQIISPSFTFFLSLSQGLRRSNEVTGLGGGKMIVLLAFSQLLLFPEEIPPE